jgi:hypothetical protein
VHRTLSGDSLDSPVNYSGAPSDFPEGDEFDLKCPGAPDILQDLPSRQQYRRKKM